MSREPSATEPAAQATGIAYRWLLRGSTIALAAAALGWIAAIAPDVTNPAVPQIAGRVARGERYEVDRLRRIVSDNLPSARRLCSAKTLRELLLLQLAIADESTRAGDLTVTTSSRVARTRICHRMTQISSRIRHTTRHDACVDLHVGSTHLAFEHDTSLARSASMTT